MGRERLKELENGERKMGEGKEGERVRDSERKQKGKEVERGKDEERKCEKAREREREI